MSATSLHAPTARMEWNLPDKGRVGMSALIVGESAIFTIFVVAYIFYMGKSLTGPKPGDVLEVPVVDTICLLSSSLTIWRAEHAIENGRMRLFTAWLGITIMLAVTFLLGTASEWHKLIYRCGMTIRTNLFGTTFYSLVGLHATHVVIGLVLLSSIFIFSLLGWVEAHQKKRFGAVALYWHFVDAVWIVVFTVVYLIGR